MQDPSFHHHHTLFLDLHPSSPHCSTLMYLICIFEYPLILVKNLLLLCVKNTCFNFHKWYYSTELIILIFFSLYNIFSDLSALQYIHIVWHL